MVGKVTPNTMMSASRIPALLGMSKYASRNDTLQAVIQAHQGIEEPWKGSEAADWGNALEPTILAEAAKRLQLRDLQLDHPEARFHPDLPLACSLDGTADGGGQRLVSDPASGIIVVGQDSIALDGIGVLEAKLTSSWPEDVPALDRGPLQLQAQMDIIGAKWGAVCVLYQGIELRIFLFAPHPESLAAISDAVFDFDRRVQFWRDTGAIDWYPADQAGDTERIFPVAEDTQIDLPAHAAVLIDDMQRAAADIEDAQARKTKAETALKLLLGTATEGRLGSTIVRWPMRHYKAQPEKITPAKAAYSIRQSTLALKEVK